MDDTTKTVLGMLGAFITAFLAEPVKIYFQNRAKLNNLRISFYKELWYNYDFLTRSKSFIREDSEIRNVLQNLSSKPQENLENDILTSSYLSTVKSLKDEIKIECYKQALNNDLYLLYQLDEIAQIHTLYGRLNSILRFAEQTGDIDTHPLVALERMRSVLSMYCETYTRMFLGFVYEGFLNKKVLMRYVISKGAYNSLIAKGKASFDKKYKEKKNDLSDSLDHKDTTPQKN